MGRQNNIMKGSSALEHNGIMTTSEPHIIMNAKTMIHWFDSELTIDQAIMVGDARAVCSTTARPVKSQSI